MKLRAVKWIPLALVGLCLLGSGCATVKKTMVVPSSYLTPQQGISVEMKACPEVSNLPVVGGGFLTMAVIAARRASTRDLFEGITGDTVKDLLKQELERKFSAYFDVASPNAPLVTEVNISHWGLNSNSTVVGIKTSGWWFQIWGTASIFDRTTQRRKEVGYVSAVSTSNALGNEPTPKDVQEAMVKCVDSFSQYVVEAMVKTNAPTTIKIDR